MPKGEVSGRVSGEAMSRLKPDSVIVSTHTAILAVMQIISIAET